MIKRKLQVILFAVLLSFSAVAQSQTTGINNPLLTRLAQQFIATSISSTIAGTTITQAELVTAGQAVVTAYSTATPAASGGSVVIGGVVQEITSATALIGILTTLAQDPSFDSTSVTILTAASPSS